jgi:hypothetical protein
MAVQFLHGIDLAGTLELKSLSTNTSSTTALVMSGDEVQKRTLGTAAFVNTTDLNLSGDYVPLSGGSGVGQAMTGNLHIQSGSPIIYLKDTTDDDDQQINFQNNGGTVEYVIRTQDFTSAATGDGMFIGSISSDKLALVTNNTTALTIDTSQRVGVGTDEPKQQFHVRGGSTSGSVTKAVIGATGGNAESYLYLAEHFQGDNVHYGFSFVADGNSSNNLLIKRHSNSTSGVTVMTVNRDDSTVTFNGGSVVLGGTGRIQGIDTVSSNTDAANKLYVDNHTYSHNHDDRYYTESESDAKYLLNTSDTLSGNLYVTGNLTVDGTNYGLYHATSNDNYYFDSYDGAKHLSMFIKNARADIIRYQDVANFEYWNGSSWVADSSQLANVKKLLDGRQDTYWAVPETYYKFRFTVSPSTVWPLGAKIGQQLSWSGSSYPGSTMLVEEDADDGNGFQTKVTADFTSTNGISTWGLMFRADNALHTGKGASHKTRITVDYYGWTPSNNSHVTIPLQNLFITSNYSGTENTDYTNLLDYDRNVTVAGNIVLGTGKTVDGVDISALPTSFAPVNAEQNVQANWNESDSSSDAFIQNKPTIPTDHGDHDGLYLPIGGGSLTGDLLPDADSNYDIGSNTSKWAEGHFDHLYVGETGNNPRIDIYTENGTASLADTFSDTSTDKSYIYFNAGTSSNDPGFIMHETSESSSPDERNEGVLHLVPSDDNNYGDYVSIHGTNDPDALRLHASGAIETASNYQLALSSGSGSVKVDDSLDVTGNITVAGTVDGVDISSLPTSFAPTDAEKNVQADWNATSGDALILNKPTIPTDHGDHDGLYLPIGGGTLTGALTIAPATGLNSVLNINGDQDSFIEKDTGNTLYIANNANNKDIKFRVKDNSTNVVALTLDGSENGNASFAGQVKAANVFIADDIDVTNAVPADGNARFSGYGLNGNRGAFYITNGGGTVQIGNGATHNADPTATFSTTLISFARDTFVGAKKYTLTVNAPTNLSTTIVNSTINVTFTASTTTNIDYYLVFSSVDGGDYGLISVIPPADFGATMSIIDDSFDATGTQAYRVYAVKNGVYSSPLTGSKSYSVTTPLEPTNMSVVNLNTAYYVQWDPPSANARFVSAYNVYKHEHATQGSLSRSSATLIYSGLNTSYMYQISGANNGNYHQFWVETTIA